MTLKDKPLREARILAESAHLLRSITTGARSVTN
jgi:hypothetical protein